MVYDPFDELKNMEKLINKAFGERQVDKLAPLKLVRRPVSEVKETENKVLAMIELPGIPKEDICAIDTRDDRRAEIESVGVSKCYSSLDEALQKENIDAAIMCSPTSLHISQGISLAKKGIHILMEKPLAHNLEGIDEFIKVVEENKVVILMAYIFRFSPLTKKVKEILDSICLM